MIDFFIILFSSLFFVYCMSFCFWLLRLMFLLSKDSRWYHAVSTQDINKQNELIKYYANIISGKR